MFALKRTSLGSVLDCVAPCLEESLLSLAKLRLEKSGRVSLSTLNVWMFGSRTTVKKVRNLLTWFSHVRDITCDAIAPSINLSMEFGIPSGRK